MQTSHAFPLLTTLLAMAGTFISHVTPASAQAYPTRPVRFVVPFAPGGGTDIIGRSLAQPLSEALGQPVLIDNRAGAGGAIGAEAVARSAPDGYTLLMGTPGSLTINPNLMAKVTYSLNDFSPITLATISPFVIVVHPSTPANNIRELIALARAKPNALNYGSSGNGSVSHLAGEQFKSLAGVQITHIPYKSGGQSITDLIAGQVQINFENLPVTLPHVRSGKLRLLAVGTTRRSAQAPETPTVAETLPGYEASTSSGVLSVARTPAEIINRLNRDLVRIIQGSSFRDKFRADGWEAVGSTPEQYAAHLRDESTRIAATAKAAGITLD